MKRRNFLKGILGVAATAAGVSTVEHEMSRVKKAKSNDLAFNDDEGLSAYYPQDVTPHNSVDFDGFNDYVNVPDLDTDGWKHIAYTKDENGAHLYLNGKQVFEDRIVGFRAYDRILTPEEIETLYRINPHETIKIWKV